MFTSRGPGYWDIDDARVDWTKVAWGIGGGVLKSDSTHGGSYAANVIVNTDEWYELTLPLWAGRDVTIDFSDPPGVGIPAVTLKLKINGLPCILNSSDAEARRFVYPYGLDHTYSLSEGDYDGRFCAEVLDALEFPEQVKLLTVFSSTPPMFSALLTVDESLFTLSSLLFRWRWNPLSLTPRSLS